MFLSRNINSKGNISEKPSPVHGVQVVFQDTCQWARRHLVPADAMYCLADLIAMFRLVSSECVILHLQFSSVTQLCLTLCDPIDCSTPGFPVYHQCPELAQTHIRWVGDTVQPPHSLACQDCSKPAFWRLSLKRLTFQPPSHTKLPVLPKINHLLLHLCSSGLLSLRQENIPLHSSLLPWSLLDFPTEIQLLPFLITITLYLL